jgi:curved DNA-binding protein CbpA
MQNDVGKHEAEEELKRINQAYDVLKHHFEKGHTAESNCSCQPPVTGSKQQKSNHCPDSGTDAEQNKNQENEARRRDKERRRKHEKEASQAATDETRRAEEQRQASGGFERALDGVLGSVETENAETFRWRMAMLAAVAFVLLLALGSIGVAARNAITEIQHEWHTAPADQIDSDRS